MSKKHYSIETFKNIDDYLVRIKYRDSYNLSVGVVSEVENTDRWTYTPFLSGLRKPSKTFKTVADAAAIMSAQVHKFYMRGEAKKGETDLRFHEVQTRSNSRKIR